MFPVRVILSITTLQYCNTPENAYNRLLFISHAAWHNYCSPMHGFLQQFSDCVVRVQCPKRADGTVFMKTFASIIYMNSYETIGKKFLSAAKPASSKRLVTHFSDFMARRSVWCPPPPLYYTDHFKIVVRLCLDWWTLILISCRILVISVYPIFVLATALAYRDPGFCINCPSRVAVCYGKDSCVISRALSPSLERIPCLYLCANRRMRLPPRIKLNLGLSLLLLLAGDVSLNPGPVAPNLRLGTVSARSMRDKGPSPVRPCGQQGHRPFRYHRNLADHKGNL